MKALQANLRGLIDEEHVLVRSMVTDVNEHFHSEPGTHVLHSLGTRNPRQKPRGTGNRVAETAGNREREEKSAGNSWERWEPGIRGKKRGEPGI